MCYITLREMINRLDIIECSNMLVHCITKGALVHYITKRASQNIELFLKKSKDGQEGLDLIQ